MSVSGGSRIVRGGGFVLGKDIETPKSSTEIGCGDIPSPPHWAEVCGGAVPLSEIFEKIRWEYYILLYFRGLLNNF